MSTNSAPDANQTVVQNVIPPLMACNIPPPTGLQTTSSPGTITAIGSPEFSSATAQEVRNQFERDSRQQPLLENVNLEAPINSNDGPSLREYITASVRIAQNQALRTMEERLAVMIPQVVRNSIDSLRNSSFNTQDPNRYEQEPTLNSHYMPNNFEQRQQQTNNNNREHYSQNFSQNFAIGCKPKTPLQLQKWGLKFDERLKEYNKKRAEIFKDFVPEVSKRVAKARKGYSKRKTERKVIASAYLEVDNDIRPYLKVKLNEIEFTGLMDSGASISCLGSNCIENAEKMNAQIFNFKSCLRTADGKQQQIVGKIKCDVKCGNEVRNLTFYLVPSLKQSLILGYDFWQTFNIKISFEPNIINKEVLEIDEERKMHDLTYEQNVKLENAKLSFRCYTKYGLGKTHLEQHSIDIGNSAPKKMRYYPVSPAVQKLMYDELDRMLELDVIEIARNAEWNNRVTLVIKPNKNRLCLDARELNKVTRKDAYPLPNIEGLLARLGDTHFISAIDLKDAFWQIPLEELSRPLTAFTVQGRPHYQFKVMPFGLCNAAQRMCRLMDKVIPSELKDRVFVYLDDLLVVSQNFDVHIEMLKTVGDRLTNAGLTINMDKSKFCYKELRYLGYIVGAGKLKPDPGKIEAIMNIKSPKNQKDVRKFLDTLKKSPKFIMTPEATESFEKLKICLVSSPVLSSPDFSKPFFVQCDASNVGVGAVLFQKGDDDGEHPIEYFSKKLNSAQRNYSTTEKECLAVILAIERFRQYIELMDFTVITDHSSLQWLMRQKDLNGRLARWSLKLQGYRFTIEHRKGTKNVVPDMLSRLDMEEISVDTTSIIDFDSEEFKNPIYLSLIDTIEQNKDRLPDLKTNACCKYPTKPLTPKHTSFPIAFDIGQQQCNTFLYPG
ncbi:uncharacterized protein LOC131803998 [Musca domestica]|uniref:RNA-directed DNA polymerase n=1 Tax=Musca domestica TaxID=7370 RepID=A0ABM3V8R1_MUSDO|nr:uncharacterized protein LOC131803998 [Musca domestica]